MIVLVGREPIADGQIVTLDEDEGHHLRVRRAAPGDRIDIRDGAGLVGEAVLLEVAAKKALARVISAARHPRPPVLELLVGAGDKDRFGWLVEKAAELGVSAVIPVETERSGNVAGGVGKQHIRKLARRAVEAIKQSGAAWAPEVLDPLGFGDALGRESAPIRWLADAGGSAPPSGAGAIPGAVLVGPEGGLTDTERRAAIDAGWHATRLGAEILRFETAAIVAAGWAGIIRGSAHG